MRAVIGLEWMAEDMDAASRRVRATYRAAYVPDAVTDLLRAPSRRPWVARITGRDPRYGYARAFVRGQVDYSQANSVGSRGVMLYFALESDAYYQVHANVSWSRMERYCIHTDAAGAYQRVAEQEVEEWLRTLPPSETISEMSQASQAIQASDTNGAI